MNDKYLKFFVNPYMNKIPEVLMNEIKTKKIPLPQLKPGGKHFKSFQSMYGAQNSHSSKHRPLTSKQKAKKIKVPYPLSNKQRDYIRCFECGKESNICSKKIKIRGKAFT